MINMCESHVYLVILYISMLIAPLFIAARAFVSTKMAHLLSRYFSHIIIMLDIQVAAEVLGSDEREEDHVDEDAAPIFCQQRVETPGR